MVTQRPAQKQPEPKETLSPELLRAQRAQRLLVSVGVAAMAVSILAFIFKDGDEPARAHAESPQDVAPELTGYGDPDPPLRALVPANSKKPAGTLSTDLCRALDEGPHSDLVFLTDFDEEQRFSDLFASVGDEEGSQGLTLRRQPDRDGRRCFLVKGKTEPIQAVLVLERIEGLWHIVGCQPE